jgi:hypothetical protein
MVNLLLIIFRLAKHWAKLKKVSPTPIKLNADASNVLEGSSTAVFPGCLSLESAAASVKFTQRLKDYQNLRS